MKRTVRFAISSCLLGQKVRWDGGHRLDRFILQTLGRHVTFVPVCPEVEYGLSVPREPLHLIGEPDRPRLLTVSTAVDHTGPMTSWARKRVEQLAGQDLWGYIFKSNSPSCGPAGVRVAKERGVTVKEGAGIFARVFMEQCPLVPVEDDRRLHDPGRRESFIESVFVLGRWREVLDGNRSMHGLETFHTRQRLVILSHSPSHCRMMEDLLARGKDLPPKDLFESYQSLLLEALRLKATPAKNSRVLRILMKRFGKTLSEAESQELAEAVQQYRRAEIPLIVPLTLINHHARRLGERHLREQAYLHPHPLELQLRYHV
ncbi:MAG: DUF1722 domain-containing protein [Deltaproteobacteria bacterium]|nr:DUF1722 domain-containing protein [Deltaproteobacteria bacterium]